MPRGSGPLRSSRRRAHRRASRCAPRAISRAARRPCLSRRRPHGNGCTAQSFPVGDVAAVCAAPVVWSTPAGAAPGHVNYVPGADHPASGLPKRQGPTKERRSSRFPALRSCEAVAGRLGITDRGVLSRSWTFLTCVGSYPMPASYEPLGESVRLAAVRRRAMQSPKDQNSFRLAPHGASASPGTWTGRATSTLASAGTTMAPFSPSPRRGSCASAFTPRSRPRA